MFQYIFRAGHVQVRAFQLPSTLRSVAQRHMASVSRPSAVPKASVRPPRGSNLAQPSRPSPVSNIQEERARKVRIIEYWYEHGIQRQLYRVADERLTVFRVQCYIIAGAAVFMIFDIMDRGLLSTEWMKSRGLSTLVIWSFKVIAVFTAIAAGLCLARTRGQVHAIEMVKKGSDVMLEVKVRSMLPFVKRTILARPYDIYCSSFPMPNVQLPRMIMPGPLNEKSPATVVVSVIGETVKKFVRIACLVVASPYQFFSRGGIVRFYAVQRGDQDKVTVEDLRLDSVGHTLLDENDHEIMLQLFNILGPDDPLPKEL